MNNIGSILYPDIYPSIDLHGFDRMYAKLKVEEFINDNVKLKHEIIVIVHGKGNGILKNAVHDTLKHNKNVIEYKTHYNNLGSTIVKLKIC